MAPSLIAAYEVDSSGDNTSMLTTPSFTPSNGEVIVVKGTTWSTGLTLNTPTGGGQTYTQRVVADPGGFNGYAAIWTATVSGSPGSMTVSITPASSSRHHMVVERWGSAQLAASPAVNSTLTGVGTPSANITTAGNNSVVTWCSVDEQSNDPAGRAYLLSATEDGLFDGHIGANTVAYFAYASVGAAGTYAMGMSAPTNQHWVLAGVEVQAGAGSTINATATLTGAGSLVAAVTQAAVATLNGAGVLIASAGTAARNATSTPAVSAGRTSTSSIGATATSDPTVSDG